MQKNNNLKVTEQEALDFHKNGKPGKLEVAAIKQLTSARDLALAYSPGVGFPCLEIQKNPDLAYDYTSKGNFVAVISNGTAVLGYGDLGPAASKPVMEGKSVLFKRFADIDSIDVELNSKNTEEIINTVRVIGDTWGGINLEDIKSPECFIIERKLKEIMDIPVFHDDQHGTAIIALAGLINALEIVGKNIKDVKIVVNGSGAAGLSCIDMIRNYGANPNNILVCDTAGVIYKGRTEAMNEWKQPYAVETKCRTLMEAMDGADVVMGLSVKGAIKQDMIKKMAKNPIVFAMANPIPEILPEEVYEVRPDAIVATGRSDYNNQINNVMCFPFMFRGALDTRSSKINEEMKVAASMAIAKLAKIPAPDEVRHAYPGKNLDFGREYIIPTPFDPRLIVEVSSAVAQAAMDTGVARKKIEEMSAYRKELAARLDPSVHTIGLLSQNISKSKRICFADGETPEAIKAAIMVKDSVSAKPILIGREERIASVASENGISLDGIEIQNAAKKLDVLDKYADALYEKNQRNGMILSDCQRLVKTDRNAFASAMIQAGEADTMICGLTRTYSANLDAVTKFIPVKDGHKMIGISILSNKKHTIFVSDTAMTEISEPEELVQHAIQTADFVKSLGITPRVAFVSYSTFGSDIRNESARVKDAVTIMDEMGCDFEYEGEMSPMQALSCNKDLYPFNRLSAPANILIMPGLHSASIATNLLEAMGGVTVIGPVIHGLEHHVQIAHMNSSAKDIFNLALIACV
jgi:malate dehydrogenase (oxaloacetate-decarboxylating)(NADP+)